MNTCASSVDQAAAAHFRARGFTLFELLIALTIVAILVTLAAPPFREAVLNARMTAQANDLMADLGVARSEAIKRGIGVFLCPAPSPHNACSGNDWTVGWMVFPDVNGDGVWNTGVGVEPAIKSRQAVQTGNTIAVCGVTNLLPYRPTGVTSAAGASINFVMCDGRTTIGAGRSIAINATGRPVVTRVTCPIAPTCP